MNLKKVISSAVSRARRNIRQRISALWIYAHRAQYKLGQYRLRYAAIVVFAVLVLLVLASFYLLPHLQAALEAHYATEEAFHGLQRLMLNVGTALIGAAAIVTSLVLFAMQVNIERMPHGLFRRLSTDRRLLGAFGGAFLLAIGIATFSTVPEQNWSAYVLLSAAWAVLLILLLFLYAYRRALILINPLQQLGILLQDTRNDLRIWDRRARRAMPLLEPEETEAADPSHDGPTHDLARIAFFRINSRWSDGAARGVRHAMSFARRYAEHGDYEISATALSAVVGINRAYITAKGKTFYANPPFMDDPRSRDSFITDTLEYIRQNVQIGIVRRDEQQLQQALWTLGALVRLYQTIDYSSPYATKNHAHLAAGYLSHAVQSMVPHDMADVLMEGVRLMGQSAQHFVAHGEPNEIATLTQKIASIARTGCVREDYRPVTMEGMTQLATLTLDVIRSKNSNTGFALGEISRNVALISEPFLTVPDPPMSNIHSTFLGPYYSSTSTESLRFRMTDLVNALSQEQEDHEGAQSIIWNIEQWADDLHQPTKALLLAAIRARSHFTITVFQWIAGVTELLLFLSNAPACDPHTREKLRKHARGLIATLTWIPDDKESVTFAENLMLTETMFKAGIDARDQGCIEVAKVIEQDLLSWTFKGGRYNSGWRVLERGLCACAALVLIGEDGSIDALKTKICVCLRDDRAPEKEVLDSAARGIREKAGNLRMDAHWSSSIDRVMSQLDYKKLSPLLHDIADILSPPVQ